MPSSSTTRVLSKQEHKNKYGAPPGKRKCRLQEAKDCIGVGSESLFIGHRCNRCKLYRQRANYLKRRADMPEKPRGRPPGTKDRHPRMLYNGKPTKSSLEDKKRAKKSAKKKAKRGVTGSAAKRGK